MRGSELVRSLLRERMWAAAAERSTAVASPGGAARPAVANMVFAWHHQIHMASMIQIRNVPDELHRDLKARAARTGMTLSDYLLAELRALAVRPTMGEWLGRSATWEPVNVSESPADALAAERGRHAA